MRKLMLIAIVCIALGLLIWSERPLRTPETEPRRAGIDTAEPSVAGSSVPEPEPPAALATVPLFGGLNPDEVRWPTPGEIEEAQSQPQHAEAEPSPAGSRVDEYAPRVSRLREEAAANPHATPPSLLAYAALMAERMEPALRSEDEARKLYPELESCARDDAGRQAPQVRLVCLVNAHRLAGRHPALAGRFDRLRSSNPGLARMMEMTGLSEME